MNDTIAVKLEGVRPAQSPPPPPMQQQQQQPSPAAPPAPFVWSVFSELLLCELLQRALASPSNALPSPTIRMDLRQIVDWNVLAAQLQSKTSSTLIAGVEVEKLDESKCATKLQSMILEARAQQAAQQAAAAGVPAPAVSQTLGQVSPAELQPFLASLQSRLGHARMAQMQREMEACTLKMSALETAISTEQARVTAQMEEAKQKAAAAATQAAEMQQRKQEQDSKAALQQSMSAADGSAAAAASAVAEGQRCPVCSVVMQATGPSGSLECTNSRCARSKGQVTVKLEPLTSSSSNTSSRLMSPSASSSSSAAAASTAASSSDARPSPLVIPSPSASSMPRVVDWPNSALHAPLKTGSLSRTNTGSGAAAAASPMQPPMSRQLSAGGSDSSAAPQTPSSSPYPSPSAPAVPVTDERLREIYTAILDTLVSREEADIFLEPVTEEVATGYFEVIKHPMSFRDVRNKVEAAAAGTGPMPSPVEFWNAIQLIYANCYQYNDKKTPFFKQGKAMEAVTLDLFKQSLSHLSAVPWNPAGGRKQTGRPPKYTLNTPSAASAGAPSTPSLTSSSSYTAASSPLPSSSGGSLSAQFNALGPVTPANAQVPTPSTPTRKGASGPSSIAAASSSALPPVEEETGSLSKSNSRRASVTQGGGAGGASTGASSSAAASARKAARVNVGLSGIVDPEGDELMDGGELTLAAANAGAPSVTAASSSAASLSAPTDNASEAAESESIGDDGTGGHDNAAATPGRGGGGGRGGGVAGRKRNAGALAPASATTAGTSAASAAAGATTPSSAASARKTGAGRRGGEPSTPVSGAAAAALTPAGLSLNATTASAEEESGGAEVAASGQKKRGRWGNKAK